MKQRNTKRGTESKMKKYREREKDMKDKGEYELLCLWG